MTISTIRQELTSVMVSGFSDPSIIKHSNIKFTSSNYPLWVDFMITFRSSFNHSISPAATNGVGVRRQGAVEAFVYTREGEGTSELSDTVGEIITIFENKNFNGIQCRAADILNLGQPKTPEGDVPLYAYAVRIPFFSFET